MASFYRDTFFCLFLLSRLSSVLSALYPTQPVADTVFYCGGFALVTWVDTRHKPHVAELGNLTIKLHTSQDVCDSADGLYSCSSARICTGLRDYTGIGRESSFVQYTGDSSAGSSERHVIVSLGLFFVMRREIDKVLSVFCVFLLLVSGKMSGQRILLFCLRTRDSVLDQQLVLAPFPVRRWIQHNRKQKSRRAQVYYQSPRLLWTAPRLRREETVLCTAEQISWTRRSFDFCLSSGLHCLVFVWPSDLIH